MKHFNDTKHLKRINWASIRKFLLCALAILMAICVATGTALTVKTLTMSPREQIKARLMRQIERYGWDPYSASMTIDEFYALMELFDEGKLPLNKQATAYADGNEGESGDGTGSAKNLIIPREKFFLSGLPNDLAAQEDTVTGDDGIEREIFNQPLVYDYNNNYEPYDPYTGKAYIVTDDPKVFKFPIDNDSSLDFKLYDDGRLYNEEAFAKYRAFDHGFRKPGAVYEMKDGKLYVLNTDEEYVCLFRKYDTDANGDKLATFTTYVLDADGKLYEYNTESKTKGDAYEYGVADGKLHLFEKDSVVYFLNTSNGKLYVYDENNESEYDIEFSDLFTAFSGVNYELRGGKLYKQRTNEEFNEPAGEYYCYQGTQACEWRDGVMYVAGTNMVVDSTVIKNLSYRYPMHYGLPNSGYMRPPKDWEGVKVEDAGDLQTVLVKKGINDDRYEIAGDVDQSVFQGDWNDEINGYEHGILYKNYYIKQITIDGANVNILGIIRVPETGRLVYYYLSAEEQDWKVSTTTLQENDKFIIEYTPNEYKVEYQVLMESDYKTIGSAALTSEEVRAKSIANDIPNNVVMFGSNSATKLSWVDSIFGTTASRPARTTDGAYSFDVLVPYGYEVQIFISVDRIINDLYKDSSGNDIPDIAQYPDAEGAISYTFHVDIEHTSSRAKVEETWLNGYRDYLINNRIIGSEAEFKYTRTPSTGFDGYVTYEWWNSSDSNAKVHNGVFETMSERINDIKMHNSTRNKPETGNPLGMYPIYNTGSHFNVLPDPNNGPEMLTLNDTFYNHLVKANRLVTAVLKPLGAPTFDVSQILPKSTGTSDRGSSAKKDYAKNSIEFYGLDEDGNILDRFDANYLYYTQPDHGGVPDNKALGYDSSYPNVKTDDSWVWTNAGGENFKGKAQDMWPAQDGTYTYTWLFQTNDGSGGHTLDAFEINGISIIIPFVPKYNWNNSYENGVKYDEKHPYFTETTLQDGATVTLEFLLGWKNSKGVPQRQYRVTVRGARTNVVVTGLNLIQGTGAPEFVTYNLMGVYSDLGGASSKQHAIEYYNNNNSGGWKRMRESNVVVSDGNDGLYNAGDGDYYGANLRFKIADGYGSPYYIYTDTSGKPIKNETSLAGMDKDGYPDITTANDVINFSAVRANPSEWVENGTILSQYIYYEDNPNSEGYGYYYFHITRPADNVTPKVCLLTVVAKTVKYTVRYTSSYDPENPQTLNPKTETAWYGFVQNSLTGELTEMSYGQKVANGNTFELKEGSMPEFTHESGSCEFVEMIDPNERKELENILRQYDDNGGTFYDIIYNSKATIASNSYGTIRPQDNNNAFSFVAWVLVDANFKPYLDEKGNYIYFTSGILDLNVYADYAVINSAFGTDDVDIKVFRLMPVWKANNYPYSYNVVLNWVDAKGRLNQMDFSDWDDVVTESQNGEQLFVFLNKDAIPLKNWIASHPTYIFWDSVNNATTQFIRDKVTGKLILDENGNPQRDRKANTEILKDALKDYLQRDYNPEKYPEDALILQALVNRDYTGYDADGEQTTAGHWVKDEIGSDIEDPYYGIKVHVDYKYVEGGNGVDDFDRLDANIFRVNENGGTICIWMYENKGGLIFKKNVEVEPFIGDDEFYFSITNNWVGEATKDQYGNVITPTARLGTAADPAVYKAYPLTQYNAKEGTWGFYDKNGKFTPATDKDSWQVTFVNGEIVSIERYGKLLVEKDENGKEVPVKYFTLKDEQGIALYVPSGNYTIVETGSKSGGAYQAEVQYKNTGGNDISGSVELPTGKDEDGNPVDMWVNGSYKEAIHLGEGEEFGKGKYENVSQIPATVTFLTGEKELIQTLTFYNRTNSLSVGVDLAQNVYAKYPKNGTQAAKNNWNTKYNCDYEFAVVFALPTGQTPIEKTQSTRSIATDDTDKTYYYNMNIYTGFDSGEKKFVRMEQVEFSEYNPIYDELLNPNPDRNPWEIKTEKYDNLWVGHFTLQPKETGAIVMQVITDRINYWVDEPGVKEENNSPLSNDLLPLWDSINGKSGIAEVGKENHARVINSWIQPDFGYLKITVDGGESTESFLFNITGEAISGVKVSLTVSVKGKGSTYVYVPTGIYNVTPNAWSWRYDLTMVDPPPELYVGPEETIDKPLTVTFKAENNNKGWLGGEISSNKQLS